MMQSRHMLGEMLYAAGAEHLEDAVSVCALCVLFPYVTGDLLSLNV